MYKSKVVNLGESVKDFLDNNMLILFDKSAPDELKNYCVIHENIEFENLNVDDYLNLGSYKYKITALGSMANENLKKLGHVTLMFDSSNEASMYGNVHLDGKLYIPKINEEIFVTKE